MLDLIMQGFLSTAGKCLTCFAFHVFVLIPNAFPFVGLWRPNLANLCRKLSDGLLVCTFEGNMGRIGQFASHVAGNRQPEPYKGKGVRASVDTIVAPN